MEEEIDRGRAVAGGLIRELKREEGKIEIVTDSFPFHLVIISFHSYLIAQGTFRE